MKTRTYARLSLLIPLLIWVISLLLLLAAYVLFTDSLTTSETPNVLAEVGAVGMAVLFAYVIGIFFWFIPYLLTSLILLFMSFISTEKVLKLAYFLSPIPMAAAMLILGTVLAIASFEGMPIDDELTSLQYSIATGAFFSFVSLICGYICVGLGFGGYVLMQYFGMIKGEEEATPETKNLYSQSLQAELP